MMARSAAGAFSICSCLVLASCATHTPPAIVAAPILYLNEALPGDAELCVARSPWNDGRPICVSIADLRALLRSRGDVAERVAR